MSLIDYIIFGVYFALILYIGFYFFKRNKNKEDYYVGGRKLGYGHVGLSIVATDVGGGFSIGLGGLGYLMGLSGSWLLFTGLVGAWMSAVLVVPRVKKVDLPHKMFTYPDFLRHHFGTSVATIAAVISGIGYLGFTAGQLLAGAKLATATLFNNVDLGIDPLRLALCVMGAIVVVYTVMGGIKAVIYTDTVQWIILLFGLIFLAIPFAFVKAGGWGNIQKALPAEFFTLTNVSAVQIVNWSVTIIPIWFIAMTLYQRIYALKNVKDAKKAFFVAGLLEYPVMAFMGVSLGMLSRIFFHDVDAEMGLPLLLQTVLPAGITGIVTASYFSAIMSTADSCLMASSGNIVNDILERTFYKNKPHSQIMRISQLVTLIIGVLSVMIASGFTTVLEIILNAYAFMISGLLYPTIRALFATKSSSRGIILSMLCGGGCTLVLLFTEANFLGLNPSLFGIIASVVIYHLNDFIKHIKK